MHFVQAKGILSQNNGMNIYRGCSHGCIYCDSRSKCYGFTHAFEDIEVKENAPELPEKALRSKRQKCMIGTGALCDPYLHAEEQLGLTRKCLELIDRQPKYCRIGMGILQGNGGKFEFHSVLFRQFKACGNPDIIRPHSQKPSDQGLVCSVTDPRSSKGTPESCIAESGCGISI